MQYNISQLLRCPVGEVRHYRVEGDVTDVDDDPQPIPVQGTVVLTRTNQGVLVRVEAALHSTEECARCLAVIRYPLQLTFEEVFYPTIDPLTGIPLPPPPEPEAFLIDHNHILDLSEAIREYAVMARPLQPLCRLDCAGLCPQCGANRNLMPCACAEPPPDPRWSALWQLGALE
ncbi:MAG: DUF177 domain-containing protein [Chloroflexi bacterium]|nr:DUF177 domain-containing protein [Chloroflexota bacterium]